MPTTLYPNGRIPADALDPVPAANGQTAWLLPIPAASFHTVRALCQRMHGWAPQVTSAGDGFRSYDRQVSVFRQRYAPTYATVVQGGRRIADRRVWDGVAYWRHTGPAAAIPGTSNHGLGITVDIAHLRYDTPGWEQLAPILRAEGWSNVEGARIAEPWHWNYLRTAYTVADTNTLPDVTITPPLTDLPASLTREAAMNTLLHRAAPNAQDYAVAGGFLRCRVLGSMTELESLVVARQLPGVALTRDKSGRVTGATGDVELVDDLVWNTLLELDKRVR